MHIFIHFYIVFFVHSYIIINIRVKKISERLYNINAIMPLNIFVNQKIDRFELSEEIDKVVRDELKENGV